MPNDYLIDYEQKKMLIRNGDFVPGESTRQHQRRLLMAHKGEYKQHPLAGVGLRDYVDDENPDAMIREIRKQLVADGMRVDSIQIIPNGLHIDASYEA
jgi:hypothetical protein